MSIKMNGKLGYAWVVPVPNDDLVESAVISGERLRKTKTCAVTVALIPVNSISDECISKLDSAFDLIIIKNVKALIKRFNHSANDNNMINSLFLSVLNMTTFSKAVIIRPGTMVQQQQCDSLFDSAENLVMMDKKSRMEWKVAVVSPNLKKFTLVLNKLESNGTCVKELELADLAFSEDLTYFTDNPIIKDEDIEHLPQQEPLLNRDTSDWIAIVGMACRFPQANSPEEYWNILASEQNACTTPPSHRLKLVDLDNDVKANFLKCPIDQFDANFFGFSPSEAAFTDPQARLLLEVSWEAWEDASMNPDSLKGSRTGVFYGSWLQEYRDAMNTNAPDEDFIRKYLGNSFGCSAAKLSFFYGFSGPNISTESGCSSSMVAVDLAMKSLQNRGCPVAMVAGANILLHMDIKQKVLWAEDGKSKTFDETANGYARAEGIAVMILKRYSDAKFDGDRVHAVIRGSAVSQEGISRSFGTPTVDSECSAMTEALRRANVNAWEVDYVEAHATGTAVGDPIEAQAIVKAYGNENNEKKRLMPLWIGSGKTNVGHTESCSGLAGIFKVVLAMKHQLIPRHLNLNKVNPLVNFDQIPGRIPSKAGIDWLKSRERLRIAGVSSFGITGTDVHVILQEEPEEETVQQVKNEAYASPPMQLLTLSAKSEGALEQLAELYKKHLETSPDTLEDICYTANSCRPHHQFRRAVVGETKNELVNSIVGRWNKASSSPPKICFTFPGRIGQMHLEPARILYRTAPVFKKTMDECEALFIATTGKSMLSLLQNIEEELSPSKGVAWYALIPAVQYSLVKLWGSWGIHPDLVMGHCIGEISAAVVSGALQLEDVFKLIQCMDHFLQSGKEQPSLMMAIQASSETVESLISNVMENNSGSSRWIEVASKNAFDQIVVAGDPESIGLFKEYLRSRDYRCKILQMDFCAHSRAVEMACQKSFKTFDEIRHHPKKIPYISSVTGAVVEDNELNGKYWYHVFRESVNFTGACRAASTLTNADVYIEIGLEGALSKLTQENLANVKTDSGGRLSALCLPSLWKAKGDKCWMGLLSTLGQMYVLGANVDWDGFYGGQKHRRRVALPGYPFQRKSFWYEKRQQKKGENCLEAEKCLRMRKIHPLLGGIIETCVETPKVFQNWMRGCGLEANYIYDHVIGSKVIFPGAGFLEMILTAVEHTEGEMKKGNVLVVDGFSVSSPLCLENDSTKIVQCVAERNGKTVSIHASLNEKAFPWTLHASGSYKLGMKNEMEEMVGNWEDIRRRCCVEKEGAVEEFYMAAGAVGLNLGEKFQSIKKVFCGKDDKGETLIEVDAPKNEEEDYITHPVLIDAMIQGLILHSKPELKKLHVPVKIGRFMVLAGYKNRGSGKQRWFVHCKINEISGVTRDVHLLNNDGILVAKMTNTELVMTSVESVLKAAGCYAVKVEGETIDDKNIVTLDKFDVVWKRSEFHQMANSISLKETSRQEIDMLLSNLTNAISKNNAFSKEERKLNENMNKLCDMYVVKALYEFGWLPGNGMEDVITVGSAEKWGVVTELIPAYKHFVSFLGDKVPMQTPDSIDTEINKVIEELKDYAATETVQACGSQLSGILRGKVNPHVILFGGNTEYACNLAEHYYRNCRFGKIAESLEEVFKAICEEIKKSGRVQTETLRILEVGAGTGGFAAGVVRIFGEDKGVRYEYTYTDLSPSFLGKAKERFQDDPIIFKPLNIEVDPLKQGFCPEYFDIVVAMNVIHATKNVLKSLKNLEIVTKPGGWLLLGETEKPIREIDICFGILEGYWLYEDGVRKDHCTLDGDKWLELISEAGFGGCHGKFLSCESQMSVLTAQKVHIIKNTQTAGYQGNWVVFYADDGENAAIDTLVREMSDKGRKVTLIELTENAREEDMIKLLHDNQDDLEGILFWITEGTYTEPVPPNSKKMLKPLLHTARYLFHVKLKSFPRFHLVTEDFLLNVQSAEEQCKPLQKTNENVDSSLAWGFMRNLRIELPGILSKSVDLETRAEATEKVSQLMHELWSDDKETEVAYRAGGVRYVRRVFQRTSGGEGGSTNMDCMHGILGKYFTVELPKSKVIQDVKFVAMEEMELQALEVNEVLVQVKSVSLNFKDVLAVMKPSEDFENLTSIGLDFSGVVTGVGSQVIKWKLGQAVFGVGWEQGAMRSHLVTNEAAVISMPDWMTFNEAATLPAVFLTAWYCMVEVAKIREGQTVLLHAASGGVGMAAIQIAKILGVKVIGTAGSEKKRRFLRSLGVEHVLNSRTLDFKTEITKITEGQGVDMVLNCLTGPGFKEASLEVCRDGGNFVEISKLDIWMPEEVNKRKPGVSYTIVDLTRVDNVTLERMMGVLDNFLGNGEMCPLPYKQYPASTGLKEALTYLQKAKQIGKVIVKMPELQVDSGCYRDLLFNDRSTYLITGGKGAIGFNVAKWMVRREGARYLVLVGRSPASAKVAQEIQELEREYGAVIKCVEADIGNLEECKCMLEEIGGDMPPLRGIHHLAAVLSDKLLSLHDDWNTYDRVIQPKIQGAWNLHTLTQGSKINLEFFVLYSSAATTFGNIGQSNYVAANCYLDSLAELRMTNGLPCLSVNWGQWNMGFAKDLHVDWLHPFSAKEGLSTLQEVMIAKNETATVIAGLFDFYGLLNMTPFYKDTFLRTLTLEKASFFGRNCNRNCNDEIYSKKLQKKVVLRDQYLGVMEDHERYILVKDFVVRMLCETLGTKPEDIQDENQLFTEMGMDSLMSIEFVNKINAELEGGVGGGAGGGFLDLEEYGTISKMTELVVQTLAK